MHGRWGTRGGPGRGRRAALPAWTLATVLSMVVATAGIREIAARVTAPLHLDGRTAESDDGPARLILSERSPTRTGGLAEPDAGSPPDLRAVAGTAPTTVPGAPGTAFAYPAATASWTIEADDDATTRWARGGVGHNGQPEHHLEYVTPGGQWARGYGNNASTSLTTPWIDVPAGAGTHWLSVWTRMFVEADLDGYLLAWTPDGETWNDVTHVSGGDRDDPVRVRNHRFDPGGADRVRVRLTFTSDRGGSAWDRDLNNPVVAPGEHLEVHAVAVARTVGGASPLPVVGATTTDPEVAEAEPEPRVVVAFDGGSVNPYHPAFRDRSPRAHAHPATYLAGYPPEAQKVELTLDAPDFTTAFELDRERVWEKLVPHQLYWFAGTTIVGAITPTDVGSGVMGCTPVCIGASHECPYSQHGNWCHNEQAEDDAGDRAEVFDWNVDASRWLAAGAGTDVATCPDCLLVFVDGIDPDGTRWVADQASWIDVNVVGHQWDTAIDPGYADVTPDIAAAARRQLVVTNSQSMGSDPVHVQPIAGAPGVVTVSGHDRGHVSHVRTGSHVAVNHCAVVSTATRSFAMAERGVTYQMATARAAGVYANALLEARRILGDQGRGLRDGAIALGEAGRVATGPLADGRLTMAEWRAVVEHTASPRPAPHPDGPRCHDGSSPDPDDDLGPRGHAPPTGLGAPWSTVPEDWPTHLAIGFGAIDEPDALARSLDVLHGRLPLPRRGELAAWLAADREARMANLRARSEL